MASSHTENEMVSLEPVFYTQPDVQIEENIYVPTNTAANEWPYNKEESDKQNCHIWMYILEYLAMCQERGDLVPELPPMLWPFKNQFTNFLEYEEKMIKALEEQCMRELIAIYPNLPIEPEERNMNINNRNLNNTSDNNPENDPNPNPVMDPNPYPDNDSNESDTNAQENDRNLLFNMNTLVKRFRSFACGRRRCRSFHNKLVPRKRRTPKVRAWLRFRRHPHHQFIDEM